MAKNKMKKWKRSFVKAVVIEESIKVTYNPWHAFVPQETYHMLLSSITTIIFTMLEYINKKEEPQETQLVYRW
jgi:hypothetical protein